MVFGFFRSPVPWVRFRHQRPAWGWRADILCLLFYQHRAARFAHDRRPRSGRLDYPAGATGGILICSLYTCDRGRPLLELRGHRMDRALSADLSGGTRLMIARLIRIFRFLASGLLILALATNLVTRPRREVEDDANQTSPETQDVKPRLLRLLLSWVLLLVLVAVELGVSFLPMNREVRPLILIPAVLMVATVGIVFMQVGRGPTIVRLFATAGLLWLTILLGLGS